MQGDCIKFIAPVSRELFDEYAAAERYYREAPAYSLVLLRDFAYRLAGLVNDRIGVGNHGNLNDRINARGFKEAVPENMRERLNFLRLNGNIGAHPSEFRKSPEDFIALALESLRGAHELAVWYRGEFAAAGASSNPEKEPDPTPFQAPDEHVGDLHRAAIMDGDAAACYRVGLALLERGRVRLEKNKLESRRGETRRDGRAFVFVPDDFRDAAYWFRKANRDHDGQSGGHAGARYQLGLLHLSGLGVPRDDQEGEALIHGAAEEGHADALSRMGGFYYHGSTLFARDYAKAFAYFERAAAEEHPGALTALTRMYKEGQGVERDLIRAFEFAERAAQAGFPSARYSLGLLYLEGRGVKRNGRKALEWFRLAAMDGNDAAALAVYHLIQDAGAGLGDSAQPGEAPRWLLRSLRGGNAGAAREIALRRAEGSVPDHFRVVKYYLKALEFGPDDELREKIRAELPPAVRRMREAILRGGLSEARFHACTLLAARFDENGFPVREGLL